MDLRIDQFLATSTTITMFTVVDSPSPGFSTTTVSRSKEELGPGWAMDDVYPPLAELRQALLTDEEWAAMSRLEKDVWEMFYRPDWERLACIEEILVDTPAAQRARKHEEIPEALRNLGASSPKAASAAAANYCVDCLDPSHAVPIDAASSAIVAEGLEVILAASTGLITTAPATCSTDCLPEPRMAAPVLVSLSPSTPIEYGLDTNNILVAAAPVAITGVFPLVPVPADFAPMVQLQQICDDSELFRSSSSLRNTSKVPVHRPMPWPSFMGVHADGYEARPLPWPLFREIDGCEFPSDAIEKASQWCSSDSSRAKSCVATEFQILDFYVPLCNDTKDVAVSMLFDDVSRSHEFQPWPPPLEVGHQGQVLISMPWPSFRNWEEVQLTFSRLSLQKPYWELSTGALMMECLYAECRHLLDRLWSLINAREQCQFNHVDPDRAKCNFPLSGFCFHTFDSLEALLGLVAICFITTGHN